MRDGFLCVFRGRAMIKVMSFHSGVRVRHVYGWVSIIGVVSAFGVAVTEGIELQTISQVAVPCGGNVTLPCYVNTDPSDVTLFSWLGANKSCRFGDSVQNPDFLCKSTKTPHHSLTMTLLNVMPVNQGNYLCKIHSRRGVDFATTVVTVQGCLGRSNFSINGSNAECWFSGVYPSGIIHWSQGDVNLTDAGTQEEEEDEQGRYKVWSTVDLQRGNHSLPFRCSLWIPSDRKYLSDHEFYFIREQKSSGSMVGLQRILFMVGIMMVIFLT